MSGQHHRRARLADVAKLAGVSLGSASRALSTPEQVKPVTLTAVRRAVEQLGYVSNGAVRALASRRSFAIGAVFPTLLNPAFADALHRLQEAVREAGYQLVLATHE